MSPLRWMLGLPETYRLMGIIVAIFLGGASLGLVTSGWLRIPQQLAASDLRLTALEKDHDAVRADVVRVRKAVEQMVCLQLAERQHQPWQRCVTT